MRFRIPTSWLSPRRRWPPFPRDSCSNKKPADITPQRHHPHHLRPSMRPRWSAMGLYRPPPCRFLTDSSGRPGDERKWLDRAAFLCRHLGRDLCPVPGMVHGLFRQADHWACQCHERRLGQFRGGNHLVSLSPLSLSIPGWSN